MRRLVFAATILSVLSVVSCAYAFAGDASPTDYPKYKDPAPYADDAETVAKLKGLAAGDSLHLPAPKVTPKDVGKWFRGFKTGPGRRNYCAKMLYAPERKTALYCGANHGVPHVFNDVWEYHLGSNTWTLLSPPDGGNHSPFSRARMAIKRKRGNAEENRQYVNEWYKKNVVFREGYLQTKNNGGPIYPRHTWDGVTYDPVKKRLLWAVLAKSNDKVQLEMIDEYAMATGQDAAKLKKQFKPGSSLYMFDPQVGRWYRQLGAGPKPTLSLMGGSLNYIPDLRQTLWYAGVREKTMFGYDSAANKWVPVKANGDANITALNKKGLSPPPEVQMAYSPKHKKLVAVRDSTTWIYDVVKSEWSKAGEDPLNHAHDSFTVFAYDGENDVCLLLTRTKGGRAGASSPLALRAYDIAKNKWTTLKPGGAGLPSPTSKMGYFDPLHKVLVVYPVTKTGVWIYRYKSD